MVKKECYLNFNMNEWMFNDTQAQKLGVNAI